MVSQPLAAYCQLHLFFNVPVVLNAMETLATLLFISPSAPWSSGCPPAAHPAPLQPASTPAERHRAPLPPHRKTPACRGSSRRRTTAPTKSARRFGRSSAGCSLHPAARLDIGEVGEVIFMPPGNLANLAHVANSHACFLYAELTNEICRRI